MCDLTPDADLRLPKDPQAPGTARQFVRDALCRPHHKGRTDEVQLLVSELVTNGVRYGGEPMVLAVHCDGPDVLRIQVSDSSPSLPVERLAAADDESGRGLFLVDMVSDEWGVDPYGEGKAVWFAMHGVG